MYTWKLERKREPARCSVFWNGPGREYVFRSAALPIDEFRRTIPKVPHNAIPRNKSERQEFKYPDNLMAHPLQLGVAGRTVFNYTGGMYTFNVHTLEQNEDYYIQTTDLLRLQTACVQMLGYYPNQLLFTLEMPFGLYGLPTPLPSKFEDVVQSLGLDFSNKGDDILRNTGGTLYNVVNERLQRIHDEMRWLSVVDKLFTYI